MASKVRYRVVGRTFVNGNLIEPGDGKPVYVMAAPGLQGKALELAPEAPAAVKPPIAGNRDEK